MDIRDWYKLVDGGWNEELERAVEKLEGEDQLEGELWKILFLGYYHGKFQKAEMEARMILTRDQISKRIEIMARLVIADLLIMKPYNEEYGKELEYIQSLFDELTSISPFFYYNSNHAIELISLTEG